MSAKNSVREMQRQVQENWPECAETISFSLLKMTRINDLFKHEIERCVAQYQLQQADFSVLATLRRSPEPYCLTPTDLYHSVFFSSGGLTKVLGRLADAGLIDRVDNPQDKRSKLVQLNTQGKHLVETIMPELHKQSQSLLAVLSEAETLQLETLLQKVLDHHEKAQ
jgi:DNA-binding MarR family transcriptional regulator